MGRVVEPRRKARGRRAAAGAAAAVARAGGSRRPVALRPAVEVEVQRVAGAWAPPARRIAGWVEAALGRRGVGAAVAVRVVGAAEGRRLNHGWRRKDHATNVLSFPAAPWLAGAPRSQAAREPQPLGDLGICAPVLAREAREQGKTRLAHWAHLVVHGSLHLAGFDHEHELDARRMERRERRVLAGLGFPDPYASPPLRRRATMPRRGAR